MFVVLAIILGIAWVLGFTVMKISSVALHVLLVVAAISLVTHFLRRDSSST